MGKMGKHICLKCDTEKEKSPIEKKKSEALRSIKKHSYTSWFQANAKITLPL